MTLSELTKRLLQGGIDSPETDARLLLSHFCGISEAELRIDPKKDLTAPLLENAVARRLAHEPLQHIIGEVCFYGETYKVTPDCLIPRADTEILVEQAIKLLPHGAHFADLCTGSGCIAISVCAHRPDLSATAMDISEGALAIARENAVRNGVADRIRFATQDVLQPAPPKRVFDAILSNPPYIRTSAIASLAPELAHEPRIALDGGEDGMLFYRAILQNFSAPLFLFEIGYDQKEDICRLAEEHALIARILRDYGGNDRLAVLTAR